jgi:hypothetical protein
MFLANALLNPWLMRRPLAGPPLKLADYLGGTARQHLCGLLGGALWGLGLLGSLVAGARLGLAAAYVFALSAAAVAALVWRRGAVATRAAHALAAAACLACVGGLGLFAAAQGVEYDVFADPPPPGPPGPPPSKLDVHFVPTPNDVVEMMLRQVNVQSGDVLYDLGCGDGRIVITAARLYGCRGYGCDLDPQRIVESRRNAAKYGVEHLVTFEEKNVFTVDVSEATVVATYLLPWMNVRLLPQLAKLRPGARFVTHEFGAEGVKADYTLIMESEETAREHTIRVYTAPLRREGAPPAENHVVP